MDELISIIIPVYNAEHYLPRCLDSALRQTYRNLEIVCVDDGSTDGSGRIIEEYAAKDSRIRVFHKENGGISNTRNFGLDKVAGRYVSFIDSDDQIHPEFLACLYHLLQAYGGDIAVSGFLKLWKPAIFEVSGGSTDGLRVLEPAEAIADMWYQKHIGIQAWGKLYRRELFEGVRYPAGKLYEDLATTHLLLWRARKVVYSPEPLYCYFQRPGSIMYRSFDTKNMERIEASSGLLAWARDNCRELLPAAQARFFVSNVQVLREMPLGAAYGEELQVIRGNLRYYRKSVYKDRNAKMSVRMIAFLSFLEPRLLQGLGALYKRVYR